jgi:hypothetical protein
MKDRIVKHINPPGIQAKNRGALYSAIGRIFGIVRDDATTAFNAHFPYLADARKLARHGQALSIPLLKHDTEQDYRERVAAASFYLMRAGERSYIFEQMATHYGADHYMLWDEFLRIFAKVEDPSDEDRAWAYALLERVVNPNIVLTVIDWFKFAEELPCEATQKMVVKRVAYDIYPAGLRCDSRVLCDQGIEIICDGIWLCNGVVPCAQFIPAFGTIYDTIIKAETCNGTRLCDGAIDCSGTLLVHAPEDISIPLLNPEHQIDFLSVNIGVALQEYARVNLWCDGTWRCDGSNQQSFIDAIAMPLEIKPIHVEHTDIAEGKHEVTVNRLDTDRYRLLCNGEILCNQGKEVLCNGEYLCDGTVSCVRFISLPEQSEYTEINETVLTLEPMSDKTRVKALCDGSILCDGSNQASFVDAPMSLRIVKHYWCDGRREVSCTPCDGSFLCDGTHTSFDNGWYCAGNIILEEAA